MNFTFDVPDFINDPFGIFFEDEFEDEGMDEFETIMYEQKKLDEIDDDFEYGDDYMPLYVQFVSNQDLYKAFYDRTHGFDTYNCTEFIVLGYTLSMLDQMEILKKLQMPQNDADKMNNIIVAAGEKRKRLLKEFNNGHKN